MSVLTMRRAFQRAPHTAVSWGKNIKTSASGGFEERPQYTSIALTGYVTTPKPNTYYYNKAGSPVTISNMLYFLGQVDINEDDQMIYDGLTTLVRTTNYKRAGDYTECGVEAQKGVQSV